MQVLRESGLSQDNTLADRPMVELLTMLMHMLDMARHSASARAAGGQALSQLVLILADGRFHEKESLRRVVEVLYILFSPQPYGNAKRMKSWLRDRLM